MATSPWQSVFSDGTSGWQNMDTGETQWGGQMPDWSQYMDSTFNASAGETGSWQNTLTDLGSQTFSPDAQSQLQMAGNNIQLANQVAADPWQSAGFVNAGPMSGVDKSIAFGKQFGMDPTQAYQWWKQGQGNTSLYAGAEDTGNWALRDGWGASEMLRQSGNWTQDLQNQLNQYVDQGYQDMNTRRTADKKDEMGANLKFAGMLAALGGAGFSGALGGINFGVQPGYVGAGLGELGAGAAAGAGEGIVGWDALGNAASGGTGQVGAGAGTFSSGGNMFDIDELLDWGSSLGDGGMGPNIESSVLNSGGFDYSMPGMGSTPAPGALENGIMNTIYGQGSGMGGQMAQKGLSGLLQQFLGGGGAQGGFQARGGGSGGFGGYSPDVGGILGALMEYQGQNDFQDKLDGYMQQASSKADPFAANRAESGDMLMKLMRDPMSNPAMQALSKQAMDKMRASDAAQGRNFAENERYAQLAGLMAGQVPAFAQQLGQMAGTNRAGAESDVISKFSMPMATAELGKSGALGYGANAAISGQQPSLMSILQGGPQQNQNIFGMINDYLGIA